MKGAFVLRIKHTHTPHSHTPEQEERGEHRGRMAVKVVYM